MVDLLDPNPDFMHYLHPPTHYTFPHPSPLLLRDAPLVQYGGGGGELLSCMNFFPFNFPFCEYIFFVLFHPQVSLMVCPLKHIREVKQRQQQRQQERQESNWFRLAKQLLCTHIMLFCTFLSCCCTTTT